MKKFKTIFILQIVSDRILRPKDSWRGMGEIACYLCNIDSKRIETPAEFLANFKFNYEKIKQAILEQHPNLSGIPEEAKKLSEILADYDWVEWGQNKVELYGDELELSVPNNIDFIKVLPIQSSSLN